MVGILLNEFENGNRRLLIYYLIQISCKNSEKGVIVYEHNQKEISNRKITTSLLALNDKTCFNKGQCHHIFYCLIKSDMNHIINELFKFCTQMLKILNRQMYNPYNIKLKVHVCC